MHYVFVTAVHIVYAIVSAWAEAKSRACTAVMNNANDIIQCGWLDTNDELYSSPCPNISENPAHLPRYLLGLGLRCKQKCGWKTKILQTIYQRGHRSCCAELGVRRGTPIMVNYICGKYNLNRCDKIARE
ncbi:hypothetical protein FGIG_07719 [Fasciola gigantica]|uniref:Uncharacterized protein n=1 Tax=Fasciola gigantica TaxID=46835 RepID=A0A504YX41_FASGI|nr:hypothetical protein FGIG_07719 [Fasciola gigantica]